MALVGKNDFMRAKVVCGDLCKRHSKNAEGWFLFGAICGQLGEFESAAKYFRKAIALRPDVPTSHYNLGVVLHRLGNYAGAERSHRQTLKLNPMFAEAHLELGNAFHAQQQHRLAIESYQRALALRRDLHSAYCNLGNSLYALGDIDAAITNYNRAIQQDPGLVAAYFQLGVCAGAQGRTNDEIEMYKKAVELDPSHTDAFNNLGLALEKVGMLNEAISAYRKAIAINPDYHKAHSNLGMALQNSGQLDQAETCFNEAIRLAPNLAETYYNLGGLLYFRNSISQAEQAYRKALVLKPLLSEAHVNLGNLLLRQGRHYEAIDHFREAIDIHPDLSQARSNILFALNYLPDSSAQSIWDEHVNFGRYISAQSSQYRIKFTNPTDPEKPLRIGYVSGDFRMHATAHFLYPILENHNHQKFHIYCYANQSINDDITERFRSFADFWRDIHDISDEAAAQLIMQDGIDILIDLSGHTHGARLMIFAFKPAPIQVTWLGYINTTGLDTIDYRIVDPTSCPPGMFDRYHTEKLLYMPHHQWCYRPPEIAPDVEPLPAEKLGHVTFASVSNTAKITDSALAVWMDILAGAPRSRLLIIGNALESRHDLIKSLAGARAVDMDRIEYIPEQSFRNYLELHQRIDVNLDAFPYCGGATICNSLWMGVPVITLAGDTVVSRGGASLTHVVGLDELTAFSTAEYIEKAVTLAGNIGQLKELRSTLRQRLEYSDLTNSDAFTRELELLYRNIWTNWCHDH